MTRIVNGFFSGRRSDYDNIYTIFDYQTHLYYERRLKSNKMYGKGFCKKWEGGEIKDIAEKRGCVAAVNELKYRLDCIKDWIKQCDLEFEEMQDIPDISHNCSATIEF